MLPTLFSSLSILYCTSETLYLNFKAVENIKDPLYASTIICICKRRGVSQEYWEWLGLPTGEKWAEIEVKDHRVGACCKNLHVNRARYIYSRDLIICLLAERLKY